MNSPNQTLRRLAWIMFATGLTGLCACDRNTAPPRHTTPPVIELTRGEHVPSKTSLPASQSGTPALPYGAAAPMAAGTDGVKAGPTDAPRMAGLDQAPLPIGALDAIVN